MISKLNLVYALRRVSISREHNNYIYTQNTILIKLFYDRRKVEQW